MKKKQVSESDFDFFNVSSELKKVEEKQSKVVPAAKTKTKVTTSESPTSVKKAKVGDKKTTKNTETKKKIAKVDGLFVVEEEEKDPFKTVQVRTSLWKEAEAISKKIEVQTGKKYSATKVLNRILEDYFKR
jgi:hypothetical protein